MGVRCCLLPFLALALIVGAGEARAVEEIKPPFGVAWGEPAERLERLLKGAKARIVARRPTMGGLEVWEVEGLATKGLRRTLFYFRTGELVEVELQYQREDWDQKQYDEYMGQVRQAIVRKFGEGAQIARKTEPADNGIVQTIVGYKWNQNNAAVELFYYSAQDGRFLYRTISVHYKTN
jgi:hypothetical protein